SLTSRGEITPTSIIASIQSTSNNTIIANHLSNNQFVQKDDLIIQYSETMEQFQKETLERQLATVERQKSELEILISSLEQGSNLFAGNS
ncbi:bacteriocin ABC transporter ATP-binding protein, partial [Listeria monocytogenes]